MSSRSRRQQFILVRGSCDPLKPFCAWGIVCIHHAEVEPLQQRRKEQEHLHLGERVSETDATSWNRDPPIKPDAFWVLTHIQLLFIIQLCLKTKTMSFYGATR